MNEQSMKRLTDGIQFRREVSIARGWVIPMLGGDVEVGFPTAAERKQAQEETQALAEAELAAQGGSEWG